MNEGHDSPYPDPAPPRGFAVAHVPPDAPGFWSDITELTGGRIGAAIGRCPGPPHADPAAPAIRNALRDGAGPAAALEVLPDSPNCAAVCAVIDPGASTLAYSGLGDVTAVLAAPDTLPRVLDTAADTPVTTTLSPGDTLLLCTGCPDAAGPLLDGCATAHPRGALDHLISALSVAPGSNPFAALLYRHPPGPLDLTLSADSSNLAVVRDQVRAWLALAAVGAEDSADALLAIGEAASNSAEHAVLGVDHAVQMSVHASITGNHLRVTVSDNGRWKPVQEVTGYRGHGIKLINALVDTADVTTGEHGTTVTMLKEMKP